MKAGVNADLEYRTDDEVHLVIYMAVGVHSIDTVSIDLGIVTHLLNTHTVDFIKKNGELLLPFK